MLLSVSSAATTSYSDAVTGGTGDSSLYGYAYIDADGNGERDASEIGVPGVLITLSGTSDDGDTQGLFRLRREPPGDGVP